jgi:poly(3-hydroxyalkanoate) synthetase
MGHTIYLCGYLRIVESNDTRAACRSAPTAGMVGPPGSNKGHWQNSALPKDADGWFPNATVFTGSWRPVWGEWALDFSDEVSPNGA